MTQRQVFVLDEAAIEASQNEYLKTLVSEGRFLLLRPSSVGNQFKKDVTRNLKMTVDQKEVPSDVKEWSPAIKAALEPTRLAFNQGGSTLVPGAIIKALEQAAKGEEEEETKSVDLEDPSVVNTLGATHATSIAIKTPAFPWQSQTITLTSRATEFKIKNMLAGLAGGALVSFAGFVETRLEWHPLSSAEYERLMMIQAGDEPDMIAGMKKELAQYPTRPPGMFKLVEIKTDNLYLHDALCSKVLPDFTARKYKKYVELPGGQIAKQEREKLLKRRKEAAKQATLIEEGEKELGIHGRQRRAPDKKAVQFRAKLKTVGFAVLTALLVTLVLCAAFLSWGALIGFGCALAAVGCGIKTRDVYQDYQSTVPAPAASLAATVANTSEQPKKTPSSSKDTLRALQQSAPAAVGESKAVPPRVAAAPQPASRAGAVMQNVFSSVSGFFKSARETMIGKSAPTTRAARQERRTVRAQ